MPLIKCFNSLLALKWSGSCIWWCLQAPSKLSIPIQVAGWSLGKCVPELQLWTFNSLVRERETVKVCYFYILCAVGVALSLHDHKVTVILCLWILLTEKRKNILALDLLFWPFFEVVCVVCIIICFIFYLIICSFFSTLRPYCHFQLCGRSFFSA